MIDKNETQPKSKRVFRLHITITLLFVVLTLPVTVIFGFVTYRANEQLIANHTDRFVQKTLADNAGNVGKMFNPMLSSMRTATTMMRDNADYFMGDSSTDFLQEIVASDSGIYAAYASFEDGSFRQVRRAVKGEQILSKPIPPETQFISRFVDGRQQAESGPVDTYSYQWPWGVKIGEDSGPLFDNPRTESFYKNSLSLKIANISDPYLIKNSGELGVTIASPVIINNTAIGVVAMDLTLKSLSQFLAEHKSTPNTLTIIADESGEIVAHPQFDAGVSKKGDATVPNRINKLQDQRVLVALGERLRTGQDRFKFRAGNEEYLALFSPFPREFNESWEIITLTPTNDFVGEIRRTNRDMLIFSVVALFTQIILIYMISRMIARPIEQLAREVMYIREFRFDKIKKISSPVSEIRYLSDAISLLERALESFISYVPTVLVKQLLESGQGAKLGVESRFLTILFTDIEGFSTLSESEPSQQLLQRVSNYFATVTRAVEKEQGTVDKFIGDAVMAFWGAPKVLDNHAYLACSAAVRAQRGMKKLNQEWADQKMPPLRLRIGIHCDAVLVGNIGSPERVSYTVMGDGVNVAARLEGLNKDLKTWTCVSHNVYREAGHLLCLRPIDTVAVKGRKGEFLVYELMATRDDDPETSATEEELVQCEMTKDAYAEYARNNFEGAIAAYSEILEKFPGDPVAQRMLDKSRAHSAKLSYA